MPFVERWTNPFVFHHRRLSVSFSIFSPLHPDIVMNDKGRG